MVQSIELLVDEDAESALRGSWAALADAGLPSLATHAGDSNRPHVTVAVTDGTGFEAAVDALRAVVEGWDLARAGLAAVVGSPVLFGGHRHRWVLARQIVPSRPLLTLHAAVHRALARHAADAPVVEQTLPDRWTPHVTLARRVPADRLGEALAAVEMEPLPVRFTGARLWDSVEKTVTPLV
ncbi:2'-5' RNA ligase family protein [Amnibacterium kyonggiense]|uniref:2'-5' RNA ligase superfamily protein n=1 Tax=Amnibacterium kyonggiense TaxID=595671 RepID=A0A4R7FHW7_9MICO|nr:2'-5' RNA ligase family protein [Amnibacterium kyonggiense]TDS76004.1 2'-5' RNA ligase superfamily protein [Amnibacterium kyonggiense]